jgi:hypothetical protein
MRGGHGGIARHGLEEQRCSLGGDVDLCIDEQPSNRAIGPPIQHARLDGAPPAVRADNRPRLIVAGDTLGERHTERQWYAVSRMHRSRFVGFRHYRDTRHDGCGVVSGPWTNADRVS